MLPVRLVSQYFSVSPKICSRTYLKYKPPHRYYKKEIFCQVEAGFGIFLYLKDFIYCSAQVAVEKCGSLAVGVTMMGANVLIVPEKKAKKS